MKINLRCGLRLPIYLGTLIIAMLIGCGGASDVDTPKINSVTPVIGQAGTPVVVTGSKLVDNYVRTFINFNGYDTPGHYIDTITSNQINFRIPFEATTVPMPLQLTSVPTAGPFIVRVNDTGTNTVPFIVLGCSALIFNDGVNRVNAINTHTNALQGTFSLASQPLSVTIDPEGVKVYFLTAGSDQMSVVDTNKNQVIATVPVGPAPGDIAVTYHKYNNLYVTNTTKGTVTCYDNQTFAQKAVITVGQKPTKMAISYDWEWLMVVNTADNNLSVIQISTNTQTAVLPLGNAPSDIIASIMDRKMFVINTGDNTISGISVGDKIVSGTVPIGNGPWRMAYAQNGG
ncbi:MAG: YncE family protein, partial [Deltaproteobacteria bacterium]|nr:YncE family protein [Deltaproteobacteria bacterium]